MRQATLDERQPDQKPAAPQPAGPVTSMRDRFRAWRNRKLTDPAFRETARRLPGLRAITNTKANDLFAITTGFAQSQILLACVELDLFAALSVEPLDEAAIARRIDLSDDASARLLRAAEGLELVIRTSDGRWTLADHGVVMAQSPGLTAMVRHHAAVYRDLADPVRLLREPPAETETSRFWSYVGGEPGQADAGAYSELMRVSQDMVIAEVLDAYPMTSHKRVIDIGGGDGAFITAVGTRWPHLALDLFDLPAVANHARERLANAPFVDRLTIHGGSFFDDALPRAPDCYALMRVLYDHDDSAALTLLTNVRQSMSERDTLIIGEPMAGDSAGGKLVAAYFTFYLMAMRSGRCRSPADIQKLLEKAGFGRIRVHRTAMPVVTGLVSAQI